MNVRSVIRSIDVRDLTGGTGILAGARAGAALSAALAAHLPAPRPQPQSLFLDFSGVQFASASFLRESIFPFKALARAVRSSWYPVVANASPEILEELEVVCSARSDTFLACDVGHNGQVKNARLVGGLDSKQRDAYEFVTTRGNATAKALMEARATKAEESISPTAWNNRLSALVEKGIIGEISEGRQKLYIPLLRCT